MVMHTRQIVKISLSPQLYNTLAVQQIKIINNFILSFFLLFLFSLLPCATIRPVTMSPAEVSPFAIFSCVRAL